MRGRVSGTGSCHDNATGNNSDNAAGDDNDEHTDKNALDGKLDRYNYIDGYRYNNDWYRDGHDDDWYGHGNCHDRDEHGDNEADNHDD